MDILISSGFIESFQTFKHLQASSSTNSGKKKCHKKEINRVLSSCLLKKTVK